MRRSKDALLAAYLDGVGELSPTERRDVEGWLRDEPCAAAEADVTRALLGKLRELPAQGEEPAWAAFESSMRSAVATMPVPRRMRWQRWAMPIVGAVMATAALLLWLHHPDATRPDATPAAHGPAPAPTTATAATTSPALHAAPHAVLRAAAPAVEPSAVWLDGQAVELDGIEDPMTVFDDFVTDDMAAAGAPDAPELDAPASVTDELLPSSDLGWVDDLDNNAVERLDGYLKRTKG